MRIGGARQNNCTIEIVGLGKQEVSIIALGHGLSVAASVGESRRQRTFYPFKKTSGLWYVEAVFADVTERNNFHRWLLYYIQSATDQWRLNPMSPLTVTVPSCNFIKVGYPTSSISFGDTMGMAVYHSVVQFTSASDPLRSPFGSVYAPPTRDETARKFYPVDEQSHALPDPLGPYYPGGPPDSVWNTRPNS